MKKKMFLLGFCILMVSTIVLGLSLIHISKLRYYSRKEKYIKTKEVITISTYIHFTKEQREQARRTDLASFLVRQGEKVKRSGSEYEWLDGSQKVTIRGHLLSLIHI